MHKFSYCYMLIDFAEIETDVPAAFAFFKECGYAGVELNLTADVLSRLDELEAAADVANQRIADGLRQVGESALSRGVDLVIEPVNHLQVGFNNSVAEVQRLIAAVDVPVFKPMVDTIHMNIEETSLTAPILDCGESLGHVHLCESNGGVLGQGHIDFNSVLQALTSVHYKGFASVKVYRKASLREGALTSLQYLRDLASLHGDGPKKPSEGRNYEPHLANSPQKRETCTCVIPWSKMTRSGEN